MIEEDKGPMWGAIALAWFIAALTVSNLVLSIALGWVALILVFVVLACLVIAVAFVGTLIEISAYRQQR